MTSTSDPRQRSAVAARPVSPLRSHRDFRLIAGGDAVSQFGSQITQFILPLLAVTTLRASGAEIGLLQTAYLAPVLVVPLAAGVWLDRRTKRPVLIAMDAARFALVLSIPISAALGALSLGLVYVVALIGGAMTVVYDIAATSYMPVLLPPAQLAGGNSVLLVNQAIGGTGGPGFAGWLSQLIGPANTLIADALSYLVSATSLLLVRHREQDLPAGVRRSARQELGDGLRSVVANPVIRAVTVHAGTYNAGSALMNVAFLLYFVRDLHHSGAGYGVVMAAAGIGAIIGAVLAPGLIRRLGGGPAFGLVVVFSTTTYFMLPLSRAGSLGVAVSAATFGVGCAGASAGSVIAVTIGQRLTAPELYARMNAATRLFSLGLLTIGASVSGVVADAAGARTALWIAPVVLVVSALPLYTAAVRAVGRLDVPQPECP